MGKRVVDAQADSHGNITSVRFQGNSTFTPVDVAVGMAARGMVDNAHAVNGANGPHLRSNPDNKTGNNLDEMAKRH